MITFLISSNFSKTAKALDKRRLNKQRIETYQLIRVLKGKSKGWENHPATKQWVGYIYALKAYHNAMMEECEKRGIKKPEKIPIYKLPEDIEYPWFVFCKRYHNTHKASLMRKDSEYYDFDIDDEYHENGYIWPSTLTEDQIENIDTLPLKKICYTIDGKKPNLKKCKALLKSGKREGEKCGSITKDGGKYCGRHKPKD